MKKIYIKPSIVVEEAVLPAIMDILSTDSMEFAGGNGDTGTNTGTGDSGDDNPPVSAESKFMNCYGFGTFGIFDDEYDY